MRGKYFIFLILIFMFCSSAHSEGWEQFYNSSSVYRIRLFGGSLWCGTGGGILRYDLSDSSFTQYINGLNFPSSEISDVTIDNDGNIWVGFFADGLARIESIDSNPSVTLYNISRTNEMLSDSITCLLSVGEDVYYGSTKGIAKFFDNVHSKETNLTDFLEDKPVYDIFAVGDSLWVGYSNGVVLFDRNTLQVTSYSIGATRALCGYEGHVYCLSDSGVFWYDGGSWNQLPSPVGETLVSIASGGGKLFCTSRAKVFEWSQPDWVDISGNPNAAGSLKHVLFTNYRIRTSTDILKSIAVDSNGVPWVGGVWEGARRGGYLTYYQGDIWINRSPALISHNDIMEMDIAPNGGLWVSTKMFGLSYRSPDNRWITYTKWRGDVGNNGLSYFGYNLAMLYDSKGNLWCSALDYDLDRIEVGDPLVYDDDVWSHYTLDEGTITTNRFVKAKEDPAGNRWFLSDDVNHDIGMWGINILSADGNRWLSVNPENSQDMEGGNVFDCAFGSSGRIYVAIRGYGVQLWYTGGYDWSHLSNFSDDFWSTILGPDDLTSTELHAIALGSDGSVWVGTSSGLVRYKSGLVDSITIKQNYADKGLIGATVNDIEFDGSGNLWVATERGLNKVTPEGNIEAFTTADMWQNELQFVYPNSIISPLCSPICTSLQYDPVYNVMWIGTSNGLVRLDLTPAPVKKVPLDQVILYPNPLHISRGDNSLRISRISGKVNICVYTIEGELVHEAFGLADGDVAWDLLSLNGYQVTSGIYLVRIDDGTHSIYRKVAVIR